MEGKRITTCVLLVEQCGMTLKHYTNIAIQFFRLDDGAYRIEYDTLGQEILKHFLPTAPYVSQVLRKVYGLRIASLSDVEVLRECIDDISEYERKEKEKETAEMIAEKNYFLVAEHGVSCIIKHRKQEEVEICVKIIKHTTGRYEVIYYGYEEDFHFKFYTGIPCLGEIRDDIRHFYGGVHVNVRDVMVLLDTALGVVRSDNLAKAQARQMLNSTYGLASAEGLHDAITKQLINSRYGLATADVQNYLIELKTTARDEYRNRERLPEISEVIFNKPATIVKWADGTKTVVKTQGKERYNKEKGLAMAIAKKAMGNSSYYYTIMERYLEDKK